MERFKTVMAFLLLWLAAQVFWTFIIRGFSTHHPNSVAVQGLIADTIA